MLFSSSRPRSSRSVATTIGLVLLAGCASRAEESPVQADQAVIAGVAESGYPAVGYLLDQKFNGEVVCGLTLIAPDAVVTAAHCANPASAGDRYVVGFGEVAGDPAVATNLRRRVTSVVRHPSYDPATFDTGSPYDIAVLHLAEPVTDRAPAVVGVAETSCNHRYVGYGRSTPGGMATLHTVYGERKSAKTCVRHQNESSLYVRGVDGGNCWGDSGGPLMVDGTNTIVAVMSSFEALSPLEAYECYPHNNMVMIKLEPYRAFLEEQVPQLALP